MFFIVDWDSINRFCTEFYINDFQFSETFSSCCYKEKLFYSEENYLNVTWSIKANGIVIPPYPLEFKIQALANGQCNLTKFCQNNGTCFWSNYTYSCNCPVGFSGQRCEYSMPSNVEFAKSFVIFLKLINIWPLELKLFFNFPHMSQIVGICFAQMSAVD